MAGVFWPDYWWVEVKRWEVVIEVVEGEVFCVQVVYRERMVLELWQMQGVVA